MADLLHPTSEFEQLIADLAAGSEEAAWRITELYTPHILRVVRASLPAIIRPKLDSHDFAQSVWASLLLKRGYLSHLHTPEQLIALLASAARNKVIDAYRHYTVAEAYNVRTERPIEAAECLSSAGRPAERDQGVADRDPTPSQIAMLREQWRRAIENCSCEDREIVCLRMRGETFNSISAKVGMSRRRVRQIVERVIDEFGK
jgi:RNA polymerase sigma factor (sigma-70 family)